MPGDSHPTGSPHHPAQRMPGQRQASRHKPEAGSRPRSWEATLWGRHVRCHELDQHLYLDGRYLALTPIEFGLFWLLLRQALQANTGLAHQHPVHQELAWDERTSPTIPERYLQRLGIVPTPDLVQAMSADLQSIISHWPVAAGVRLDVEKAGIGISRSRTSLSSHLDRLQKRARKAPRIPPGMNPLYPTGDAQVATYQGRTALVGPHRLTDRRRRGKLERKLEHLFSSCKQQHAAERTRTHPWLPTIIGCRIPPVNSACGP